MKKTLIIILSSVILVGAIIFAFVFLKNNSVIKKKEMSITLNSDYKKEYNINDEFKKPTVFLQTDDGELIDVTDSLETSFSGYDLGNAGAYTVEVKYESNSMIATTSYVIRVYSAKVESITANYSLDELLWGDSIDKDELIVTVKYTNNREEVVSDYQLKYNSSPEQYGNIDVIVSYKDVTTSFEVKVVKKVVDKKFIVIENEGKNLLTRIGVKNPTCPKDYELVIDPSGAGTINISGTLEAKYLSDTNQALNYLTKTMFKGFTLESGPEETNEAIFPSLKFVFAKKSTNVKATIYITSLLGDAKYIIAIKKY